MKRPSRIASRFNGLPSALFLILADALSVSGAAVDPSQLPRLPLLWSLPNVMRTESRPTVQTGIFLGWDFGKDSEAQAKGNDPGSATLTAFDRASGRPLWRHPRSGTSAGAALAGDCVLVRFGKPEPGPRRQIFNAWEPTPTAALDLRTGKERWKKTLPAFGDIQVWRGRSREIGVGRFYQGESAGLASYITSQTVTTLQAVDLATGRDCWRMRIEQASILAAGRDVFYLAMPWKDDRFGRFKLSALDPISGATRRDVPLPIRSLKSMHVFGPESDRILLIGDVTLALSTEDGRILWRIPADPVRISDPIQPAPWMEWRDGRLFVIELGRPWVIGRIRELEAETGRERGHFDLPTGLKGADFRQMHLLAGRGSVGLTVIATPASGPAIAIRFERPGVKPGLFAAGGSVIEAHDSIALGYVHLASGKFRLQGYAAFRGMPSEAEALDPGQRVRAILQRHSLPSAPDRPLDRIALDALSKVSGHAEILARMARDTGDALRRPAISAAIGVGIPNLAALLRGEISRPLPPLEPVRQKPAIPLSSGAKPASQPISKPEAPASGRILGNREDGSTWADDRFEAEFRFRGRLILALAELDDPGSAPLLSAMLSDSTSPTGYARERIERIGLPPEGRYGAWNWGTTGSAEGVFSHCLQSPGGRPEQHAAAYRMLARLGRPSDVAALRRFDAAVSGPGGWAHLCDDDDGLRGDFIDRAIRPNGLGLCKGVKDGNAGKPGKAGEIRVTQAEAIWLRRRRPDGSWGPPAWACDPGGDIEGYRTVVTGVRKLEDGRIEIEGFSHPDMLEPHLWGATVDPRIVFADKDGDGLTDGTEKALGTHPGRVDTDGDGIPDGMDPAPKAVPARTESGRVLDETVRYLTVFAMGGPIGLYADQGLWSGGGGARGAGVVLHWPRLDREGTDCKEYGECDSEKSGPVRHPGIRRCEEPLAIRTLRLAKDTADVGAAWRGTDGYRIARRFRLAKVSGDWRVIRDEEDK